MATERRRAAEEAAEGPPERYTQTDIQMAKVIHRHTTMMAIIDKVGRIGAIAAFAIPIWFMQPMIEDLAGKTTNINAVVSFSLAVNIALAVTTLVQYRRRRAQASEVRRQRERSDTLEALLRGRGSSSNTGGA